MLPTTPDVAPDRGVVRPARLELATFGFVVRRSIQLSYGRTSRTTAMRGTEVYHRGRESSSASLPDGCSRGPGAQGLGRWARQWAWPDSGRV